MTRVLVVGGTGMLGRAVTAKLRGSGFDVAITSTSHHHLPQISENRYILNALNIDIPREVQLFCPDVVVICAAMTNVRLCEDNRELAFRVNYHFPLTLKNAFQNARFIYISSDAVYKGDGPFDEQACLGSDTVYGRSKAAGENPFRENDVVLRCTPVGISPDHTRESFLSFLINSYHSNREVGLYENFIFSPITTLSLATCIKNLISQNFSGVFNVTSGEHLSKYEFGCIVSKILNWDTKKIQKKFYTNSEGGPKNLLFNRALSTTSSKNFILGSGNNLNEYIVELFKWEGLL